MYNLPVGPSCRGPWSPLTRGSSGGPWHQTSTYWCIHAWAPPGNAVERHVPIGLLSVSILVRLSLKLMGVICSRSGQSSLISYAKICWVFRDTYFPISCGTQQLDPWEILAKISQGIVPGKPFSPHLNAAPLWDGRQGMLEQINA